MDKPQGALVKSCLSSQCSQEFPEGLLPGEGLYVIQACLFFLCESIDLLNKTNQSAHSSQKTSRDSVQINDEKYKFYSFIHNYFF